VIFRTGWQVKRSQQPGITFPVGTAVVSPSARKWLVFPFPDRAECDIGGNITLNSSDPFVYPIINPNYLNSELDMFILREAIRAARQFVRAPVWIDYLNLPPDVPQTDAKLNKLIASSAFNLHHPVGTAAMSAKDASYGVLDPDLRVKGVAGLRVVDTSAFVSPCYLAHLSDQRCLCDPCSHLFPAHIQWRRPTSSVRGART
jgi:GMC oxidoreductase